MPTWRALKQQRSPEEHEALNDVVYRNVIRLADTVQALEALTNQSEIHMTTPVSLYALASEAAMELEGLAAKNSIAIEVTGDAMLEGDDRLLQRMIFNLMENAVKYNVPNGKVAVDIGESDQAIWITVSDTGIGISVEQKPHIFDPFFRVDKSRSREMGGSGLGLALVSRIVAQHGGRVSVEDNVPQGLVVRVDFPCV